MKLEAYKSGLKPSDCRNLLLEIRCHRNYIKLKRKFGQNSIFQKRVFEVFFFFLAIEKYDSPDGQRCISLHSTILNIMISEFLIFQQPLWKVI